jgi:hypothetical protein
MGEAKRRRQNRETGPVPVETFRAPDGHVACTLDIAGKNPFSVAVAIADLDWLTRSFVQHVGQDQVNDLRWHAKTRLALVRKFKDGQLEQATMAALMLALNYPGGDPKKKVSQQIRKTNRAHLTMAINRAGLMVTAVADRFIDLDEMLVLADRANLTHPVVVATTEDGTVTH